MADAVALPQQGMIERIPVELVHHRRHENGRIRHPSTDDDVRTLFQCCDDRLGAQIHLGRNEGVCECRGGFAILENRVGRSSARDP